MPCRWTHHFALNAIRHLAWTLVLTPAWAVVVAASSSSGRRNEAFAYAFLLGLPLGTFLGALFCVGMLPAAIFQLLTGRGRRWLVTAVGYTVNAMLVLAPITWVLGTFWLGWMEVGFAIASGPDSPPHEPLRSGVDLPTFLFVAGKLAPFAGPPILAAIAVEAWVAARSARRVHPSRLQQTEE